MGEMQAIVFKDVGKFQVETRPIPEIKRGDQMLVKVLAASICGTDVHILSDPPGYAATKDIVLGHEFVGEIVSVGEDVKNFKPGDHLICDNNLPCGVCPACQEGNSNVCCNMEAMGVQIDGVFSQYAVIPENSAVPIPKGVPIDNAIFAEPLNCVMGGVKKLKVMPGDKVLVLGGGPIGIYYTSLLKANGAGMVLVSEVSEFRKEFACKSGADRVINPKSEDLKEVVMELTGGYGVDIVVDAVGVLLGEAIEYVKPAGQVLLFGLNESVQETLCQADIVKKDMTIYGSWIGHNTLKTVANLLASGNVDLEHLITHRLPLNDFEIGLEAMRKGEAMEVVLYPFDDIR